MEYTIKKGEHYSNNRIPSFTFSNKLSFYFAIDSNVAFGTVSPSNALDINKLYGMSDSWAHHHTHSVRVGWRYNDINKNIDLFGYCYSDEILSSKYICSIKPFSVYRADIFLFKDRYMINISSNTDDPIFKSVEMNRDESIPMYGLKYKLKPYYGGDEVSRETIKFYIKEIKV